MESITDVASRIRWKSIFALIFLLVAIILLWKVVPSAYTVRDDIGLRVDLDPDDVKAGESAMMFVEVTNLAKKETVNILITARTYDEKLVFGDTGSTNVSNVVRVGPKETRKIGFKMLTHPKALAGTYSIEVSAKRGYLNPVEEIVYLEIEREE